MREIVFRGFHPCEDGMERVFVNGKWVRGDWKYGDYSVSSILTSSSGWRL